MRRLARLFVLIASAVLFPSALFAQATIAGVVKDSSGAVLPGVTVEAASPALIEKVRSVTSDGTGQFRIVDLRPGSYTVTFTLTGFNTVRHEGVEITGSGTFQINADMRVGALEETITVTGETPVVDVQTVRTQEVLNGEVLTAIPTARNYQNLHVLVPGVTVVSGSQDVGGAGGDRQIFFSAHGGEVRDSRLQLDGMMIGAPQVGGGRTMYVPHAATMEEVTITTSGGLGEAETAGVVVNLVPKQGGNALHGTLFGTGASESMISNNYDDDLKARGLRAPNNAKNVFDYEGTLGGPIRKDKLWFFANMRYNGASNYVAGMFVNKNAGDPTKWLYDPDFSKQIVNDQYWLGESMRLTWQVTPRNKISAFYEDQLRCVGCAFNATPTATDEAGGVAASHPNNVGQITWTSPRSDRLLLEAGGSLYQLRYGQTPKPEHYNPELIRVTEQAGLIPGLQYRALGTQYYKNWLATYGSRASATYTTGAHSMKAGYNGTFYIQDSGASSYTGLAYRFRDGRPNQLTESAHPFHYFTHANQWGMYAQDQSTIKKLTVAGGVRYDRFTTYYPEAQVGPVRFVPNALIVPKAKGAALNDISARATGAYDVFGDGKTAVKVSFGKYLVAQDSNGSPVGPANGAPANRLSTSTARAWGDANNNFIPDCDLLNLAANGECGAADNQNFGKLVYSNRDFDPEIYRGWGVRPYNWTFDVGIQRQLMPRLAANVTYFRRWFGNFIVTDNVAVNASDYTFYNVPLPADSRLPASGTVNGFVNVNQDKFGQVRELVTAASNYGKQTQSWQGIDVSVNARLQKVLVQGGYSGGRESRDNCEIVAKLPELLGTSPMQYCHVDTGFVSQIKLLGAYTVPRVDVQVAATLQNIPGEAIQATWAAPNASIAPFLGRNLSGAAATATLNLLEPDTHFSDRVNQLDLRFSKILRFRERRAQVTFDMYNALNSNVVQTYNNNFTPNGTWRVPTAILPARVAKISAQLNF